MAVPSGTMGSIANQILLDPCITFIKVKNKLIGPNKTVTISVVLPLF